MYTELTGRHSVFFDIIQNYGKQTQFMLGRVMEEPGEQCTVVFALVVTEPDSDSVCLKGGMEGGLLHPIPLPPTIGFRNNFMQRRQCIVLQVPPWAISRHSGPASFVL
jgi:hypothetical protein